MRHNGTRTCRCRWFIKGDRVLYTAQFYYCPDFSISLSIVKPLSQIWTRETNPTKDRKTFTSLLENQLSGPYWLHIWSQRRYVKLQERISEVHSSQEDDLALTKDKVTENEALNDEMHSRELKLRPRQLSSLKQHRPPLPFSPPELLLKIPRGKSSCMRYITVGFVKMWRQQEYIVLMYLRFTQEYYTYQDDSTLSEFDFLKNSPT